MTATTYGDSTIANVIICTHYTGSAGSEVPDTTQGTLAYLICPNIAGNYGSATKDKDISGGNSVGGVDGKRNWSVQFNDVFAAKIGVDSNTTTFNNVLNWFKSLNKIGFTKVYLFIKNWTDNQYLSLGSNAAVSQNTNYLKGLPRKFPFKLGEGNIYYFSNIIFKELLI